jgi:hypothetical protein
VRVYEREGTVVAEGMVSMTAGSCAAS